MSAPILTPLSAGAISGTGTLQLSGDTFGGIVVNTNGTDPATVVVRDENVSGAILAQLSGPNPAPLLAPIHAPSGVVYYDIGGTGVTAMLYEWKHRVAPLSE